MISPPFLQMATLAEVRQREMEILLALRASNESKLLSADGCDELSVCLCHKGPSGGMLQCELCRDVFHSDCVTTTADLEQDQAWLCPLCQRSRKPPLDRVLPLLASLQRIRVRLPEGDALRFLIERTVRWQHRVQLACTDGMLEDLAGAGVAGGKVRPSLPELLAFHARRPMWHTTMCYVILDTLTYFVCRVLCLSPA